MQATASFEITVCGIEELTEHCKARVSHVVSILDPTWPVPSALDTTASMSVWSFASTT
jgi:hypothetical protein